MRRKDVQRLAAELVDAIDALRTEMAMQDATIQRQAAEIERLRAMCSDLHHDATCVESFCRLCGEGVQEWEARS